MVLAVSCGQNQKPLPIVLVPVEEELQPVIVRQINEILSYALANHGMIDDSLQLNFIEPVSDFYKWADKKRIWGEDNHWHPIADSMLAFLDHAKYYGLYPDDYHFDHLKRINEKLKDSSSQKDAALWARGDILLSHAFVHVANDLYVGRLDADSTTLRKTWNLNDSFYLVLYNTLMSEGSPKKIFESLEPKHPGYDSLKKSLIPFLSKKVLDSFSYVGYPVKDTVLFFQQIQERLMQDSLWSIIEEDPDSVELSHAIRSYQKKKGLKADGRISPALINSMNFFHKVLFARAALNLDRFKHLPDTMPVTYIMVNLPSYHLEVMDSGKIVLKSKLIVGKPVTRTPLLHSEITNFITYPQWTVPYSIVFKEMLPKIIKDSTWLNEQNLMVVNYKDEVVDPKSIDWNKVSQKNFHYMIRQKQGDYNSLGVIKFNFKNKYDVYMHDTDARSLFDNPERAFSHGCMRIQQWDSLAKFILWKQDKPKQGIDSLKAWMVRKEKHLYPLGHKIPVFVRYFTVLQGNRGEIRFFEDIYGEDNELLMGKFRKYLEQ